MDEQVGEQVGEGAIEEFIGSNAREMWEGGDESKGLEERHEPVFACFE